MSTKRSNKSNIKPAAAPEAGPAHLVHLAPIVEPPVAILACELDGFVIGAAEEWQPDHNVSDFVLSENAMVWANTAGAGRALWLGRALSPGAPGPSAATATSPSSTD